MEKYGSTEITQKKSGEMGQAKEAVFASLPRSGLLEPEFVNFITPKYPFDDKYQATLLT
jgi:hypothetical protein